MKFAKKEFPKGTFKYQKSDGYYLDEILSANLDIYARKIIDDMHFLLIITGNDSVGNGKTTMLTHVACYLTWKINQLHKLNNTFTSNNIFFNANDLIKGSPNLPKYSVVALDEGDDLTTHGMKELAIRLKRYFRKCRQLNQIVILILPSFFELPKFFALSRSHCLINVKFMGEFERGYFEFYSPRAKKLLYLKGKKEWDYNAYQCSFEGVFDQQYIFFPNLDEEVKKYLKRKHQDMVDDAKYKEESKSISQIKKELTIRLFRKVIDNTDILMKDLCIGFGVSDRTGNRWMTDNNIPYSKQDIPDTRHPPEYNNIPVKVERMLISESEVKSQEVINNENINRS